MSWPIERLRAVCGTPKRDGRTNRAAGVVQTPLGPVPVALSTYCTSNVDRVQIGSAVNLTPEQADHLLTLLRAVPPYPPPAGRTEPSEPVAFEVGGESG